MHECEAGACVHECEGVRVCMSVRVCVHEREGVCVHECA